MTTRVSHPWSAQASPSREWCCSRCRCGGRSLPTPPSRSTARSEVEQFLSLHIFHRLIPTCVRPSALWLSAERASISLMSCVRSPRNQVDLPAVKIWQLSCMSRKLCPHRWASLGWPGRPWGCPSLTSSCSQCQTLPCPRCWSSSHSPVQRQPWRSRVISKDCEFDLEEIAQEGHDTWSELISAMALVCHSLWEPRDVAGSCKWP